MRVRTKNEYYSYGLPSGRIFYTVHHMITPDTPIESAPRVSRAIVPALKRLGIETMQDLLFHFPSRYEVIPPEQSIDSLREGTRATIVGAIQKISEHRTARKHMRLIEAHMNDDTGVVSVIWFNQPFLARTLARDMRLRVSGSVTRTPAGLCFQNPSYERIRNQESGIIIMDREKTSGIHTTGLVPIYPETQGITSRWLRFLIHSSLPIRRSIPDPLPDETRARHHLPDTATALSHIHFPIKKSDATDAERRFIFEELLLWHLRSLRERSRIKRHTAPAIPFDVEIIKALVNSLPFRLTDAQRRSIWEIGHDMARPHPMHRLLEGDVGSGKTVVAAAASLLAVRAGYRVACMAPTEILARQHYATFGKILEKFDVSIGMLTGAEKKIKESPDIIIGTHALIHKNARLENLGLVIIDEQHRFGVHQRAALLASTSLLTPHFLSMTATPIPRTLALTVYGDLDLSILDEMPRHKKPVITRIVRPSERARAYDGIRKEIAQGRQAFVICPRIQAPDKESSTRNQTSRAYQQKLLLAEVKTVTEEYKKLSRDIFPNLRIAMLHGRMKAKEKATIMAAFHDGACDILVSTSVIEVGIDVPNATIMMIEGAELFGLATLHQFRGRVGRGNEQSYCFLFPTEDGPVSRRLRAVVEAKNGFELAEQDMAIRGPGDMFGTDQWGDTGLIIKGITDPALVRASREEAVRLVKGSPDLSHYPSLQKRLTRLEATLHME